MESTLRIHRVSLGISRSKRILKIVFICRRCDRQEAMQMQGASWHATKPKVTLEKICNRLNLSW